MPHGSSGISRLDLPVEETNNFWAQSCDEANSLMVYAPEYAPAHLESVGWR